MFSAFALYGSQGYYIPINFFFCKKKRLPIVILIFLLREDHTSTLTLPPVGNIEIILKP